MVRAMFTRIAGRYDLMNSLMTGGRHHAWRVVAARETVGAPPGPVLDLATGTGDLALAIRALDPRRTVIGADFAEAMLHTAAHKPAIRTARVPLLGADALALPFHDAVFAAVTSAFLLRNLEDLAAGLREMRRVTKPGGRVVTLEITRRLSTRWNDYLVDRFFGAISRPWEKHQTNSATYYLLALTLITFVMPKHAVEIAILVLAFGDPAATILGKKWGGVKIWKEKSVVGTSAFILAAFPPVAAFLSSGFPSMNHTSKLGLALTVSLVGAAAELFSENLDDNFTIPVLCAGVAALWL